MFSVQVEQKDPRRVDLDLDLAAFNYSIWLAPSLHPDKCAARQEGKFHAMPAPAKDNGDNKALIPGMTKDQFGNMQVFHYTARNSG